MQASGRRLCVHHHHQRKRRDHVERDERFGRVIWQVRIDRRRDRHCACRGDHDGVAIGGLMRDVFGGEPATRAGPVLDHHFDAAVFLDLLDHQPREQIVAAARRKADDHVDDAVGIVVSLRKRRRSNRQQRACEQSAKPPHRHDLKDDRKAAQPRSCTAAAPAGYRRMQPMIVYSPNGRPEYCSASDAAAASELVT
jgi:hypothetical protein